MQVKKAIINFWQAPDNYFLSRSGGRLRGPCSIFQIHVLRCICQLSFGLNGESLIERQEISKVWHYQQTHCCPSLSSNQQIHHCFNSTTVSSPLKMQCNSLSWSYIFPIILGCVIASIPVAHHQSFRLDGCSQERINMKSRLYLSQLQFFLEWLLHVFYLISRACSWNMNNHLCST
jgi:hypothetical protein